MKPGWPRVKFGDVVKLNTDRSADPLADGIERYVGLEHIEPEDLRIRRWGWVAEGTTFTNRFRPGQTLFGKRRAYQRKVAVADFEGVCSSDIYVFEPKDDRLLPALLPFLCQTEGFFQHAVGTSAGSLSPRTNWTQLANYEFALPPLEDQRRIAEVLSVLESLRDAYEQALLTSRSIELSLVTSLVDSASISKHRTIYNVTQLGTNTEPVLKTGPFGSKLKTTYFTSSGVPIISIGSLKEDGLDENEFFFLDPRYVPQFEEYKTQTGDIVFSRVADVGRCYLITEAESDFIISSNLIRIRVRQSLVRPMYLWLLLKFSREIRNQIAQLTTQAAGRLLINTKTMNKLEFTIPEIASQDYIIGQYQAVQAATNVLAQRLKASHNLRASMREYMLTNKTS